MGLLSWSLLSGSEGVFHVFEYHIGKPLSESNRIHPWLLGRKDGGGR